MKRIIFSISIIVTVALGATSLSSAFFSDTETSQNNILAAGSIDLKIDNDSYYNGVKSENTSWELTDLENQLFLNFTDLKPSDWGEDTISIHVDDNESWACVDVTLTQNDDNTCNEPELLDDPTCDEPNDNPFDGELAENIDFIFWIDDGDNVLETDEYVESKILAEGTAEEVLTNSWALADSQNNLIGGSIGEGLDPNETYYIGKAWCFGDLETDPYPQDGFTDQISPANTNGGILCDGSLLDNSAQTDNLLADFTFRAEQHRNNPDFLCSPEEDPILWQIGDIETDNEENPVDELNWDNAFGVFPAYHDPYIIGTSTYSDFPWNSNFNQSEAIDIDIDFDYSGPPITVQLRFSWSPGRSGTEQKQIFYDGNLIHDTGNVSGSSTSGWWENMPRQEEISDSFLLESGSHTINLKHLKGDGTLWDYIILEKI